MAAEILQTAERIANPRMEANSRIYLGIALTYMGKAAQGAEYIEAGLKLAEEIQDRQAQHLGLRNLVAPYDFMGESRKAEEAIIKAKEFSDIIGDRRGALILQFNLGSEYGNQGRYEEALKILRGLVPEFQR